MQIYCSMIKYPWPCGGLIGYEMSVEEAWIRLFKDTFAIIKGETESFLATEREQNTEMSVPD